MWSISLMLDTGAIVGGSETRRPPAAKAGGASLSEQEFERFYEQHAQPLWGYLARMTGDPSLAEDLAQKAFLRFLGTPLKTHEPAALKAFLYRIATNLVYDHWRKRPEDSTLDHQSEKIASREEDPALRHDMQKLFDVLEPRQRALLWLAHVENLPQRQIAGILGVREGSVRVLLFRARKKFASILQENGYGAAS
jgi:RNA polymerase sigma-70 factor, ECF subfamily